MIQLKIKKQVIGAILRIEKKITDWCLDDQIFQTRLFEITFQFYMYEYGVSSTANYHIFDKKTKKKYSIVHYLGNPNFDRSTGWSELKEIIK